MINDEWVPSTLVRCLLGQHGFFYESISNSQEEVSHHFEHQGIHEFWWGKKVYAKQENTWEELFEAPFQFFERFFYTVPK